MNELIKAVKDHAEAHYEDGGWDVVVECWDDQQIADCIKGARSAKGAIRKVAQIVGVYADRQADAINSAF
jgi:hypothetical protein